MLYSDAQKIIQSYNWDDGFEVPKQILAEPCCDLALALEIFYLADGYSYLLGYADGADGCFSEWVDFVTSLYNDITHGKFPQTDTPFQTNLSAVTRQAFQDRGIPAVFYTDLPDYH